jgi:predicted PurR-regulated permease PerM
MKNNKIPFLIGFAAFVIGAAGLIYAQTFVTQLLLALFLSIICTKPMAWLHKKKVPHGWSVAIVFIGVIAIFIGFGELIGTSLSSFSNDAPKYEQKLDDIGKSTFHFLDEHGVNLSKNKLIHIFDPSKAISLTADLMGQLGGLMGSAFIIIFLVLFLLMESDSIILKAKAIIKDSNNSLNFLNTISDNIRHYLFIKTLTSLLTGVIIWLGLTIIGVDYAIIWGMIAFLLNYIPNFGSIIAAVPAVLFSLVQLGLTGALWTMLIFIIVNVVIGEVIEPKVMGKGLGLSTLVVFVSLIFWGMVLGTVGMFLAIPLTMAFKIFFEQKQSTRWIAVMLGTDEDANKMLDYKIKND